MPAPIVRARALRGPTEMSLWLTGTDGIGFGFGADSDRVRVVKREGIVEPSR